MTWLRTRWKSILCWTLGVITFALAALVGVYLLLIELLYRDY